MSFIRDIVSTVGKTFIESTAYSVGRALSSSSFFGTLSRITGLFTGFAGLLEPRDPNNFRLPISADPTAAIPVVYGSSYVKGLLVDARQGPTGCDMYYALVLCEVTGTVLSTGQQSVITVPEVWWGDKRVRFAGNSASVESSYDASGKEVGSINGHVKMWLYTNGSTNPGAFEGSANPGTAAWNIMPGWTSNHTMDSLVFAIVYVEYDAPDDVRGLESVVFKVNNTCTLPGDVMYDYMTNTIYGAGIPVEDIDV